MNSAASGDGSEGGYLITGADLSGARADIRIRAGVVDEIGVNLAPHPDEQRIDAGGGALLPGLSDHHLHILSLAAALESVRCGPPEVSSAEELTRALHTAPGDGFIRGFGYHERVAGDLDRQRLDELGPRRPVRIQHRTGARWILNSLAIEALGLRDGEDTPPGLERDARGRPTGRVDRADGWLRSRLSDTHAPDLGRVGRRLAGYGVTALCDATPSNGQAELGLLADAIQDGALPQRLRVMGGLDLPAPSHADIERGALKIILDENTLPAHTDLVAMIRSAHRVGRGVAIHCVTRAELVFSATAFEEAGCVPGDRIEHASVTPPDCMTMLAALPLCVVTQPNFLCERGDAYLEEVATADQPWLYRARGFLDAGIALGGGTDAPFGSPDPWAAMHAAVDRRSAAGQLLGGDEVLTPEQAVALFVTPLDAPGGRVRTVTRGVVADLVLLDRPWSRARERLDAADVRATFRAGRCTYGARLDFEAQSRS